MYIEVHGHGPPLVLIHGWAMHGGIFTPLLHQLTPHFEVHLIDLPGHGRSTERDSGFEIAAFAARIAEKTPAALWVGWSLGGLVALHAALDHSPKVRALALIATSPRFVLAKDWAHGIAHEVFVQFGTGLRHDWQRTLERFLALEAHGSERAQAELRILKQHLFERGEPALDALDAGLHALDRTDLRAALPRLSMPSLWVAGRRDRLVPSDAMHWAARTAPRGRYLEFSTGHAPFLSHPKEIAQALIALA